MQCGSGHENAEGNRFCGRCGRALPEHDGPSSSRTPELGRPPDWTFVPGSDHRFPASLRLQPLLWAVGGIAIVLALAGISLALRGPHRPGGASAQEDRAVAAPSTEAPTTTTARRTLTAVVKVHSPGQGSSCTIRPYQRRYGADWSLYSGPVPPNYDDLNPGATVTVRDANDEIIGTGRLDGGTFVKTYVIHTPGYPAMGDLPADPRGKFDAGYCRFKVEIDDLPDSPFYTVQFGEQPTQNFSRDELEAKSWKLSVTFGDAFTVQQEVEALWAGYCIHAAGLGGGCDT
jgi:hypothetical protein